MSPAHADPDSRAPGKRTLTERIQRKARPGAASGGGEPSSGGPGGALPEGVRGSMEQSFAADFSSVRIHTGDAAAALGARAFTRGEEIHFAPGEYDPSSAPGRSLLGHELAHVVQQRAGRVSEPQHKGGGISEDRALEAEADDAGERAARGEPAGVTGSGAWGGGAGATQAKRYVGHAGVAALGMTPADQARNLAVAIELGDAGLVHKWLDEIASYDAEDWAEFVDAAGAGLAAISAHLASACTPELLHRLRAAGVPQALIPVLPPLPPAAAPSPAAAASTSPAAGLSPSPSPSASASASASAMPAASAAAAMPAVSAAAAIEVRAHPPALGMGTDGLGRDQIVMALRTGYRIFDLADGYGNQAQIGEAFDAERVLRADLFLVYKFHPVRGDDIAAGVRAIVVRAITELRVDHLDVAMLHDLIASNADIRANLRALQALKAEGLVHRVGLSNVTADEVQRWAVDESAHDASMPRISHVENRFNLLDTDDAVRKACDTYEITYIGFNVLGGRLESQRILANPRLVAIAADVGVTVGQLLIAWGLTAGAVQIPVSSNAGRMQQNLDANDHAPLSAAIMGRIAEAAREIREQAVAAPLGLPIAIPMPMPSAAPPAPSSQAPTSSAAVSSAAPSASALPPAPHAAAAAAAAASTAAGGSAMAGPGPDGSAADEAPSEGPISGLRRVLGGLMGAVGADAINDARAAVLAYLATRPMVMMRRIWERMAALRPFLDRLDQLKAANLGTCDMGPLAQAILLLMVDMSE